MANPVIQRRRGGRPRKNQIKVVKLVVFKEKHANGKWHFHVALKLSGESRWVEFKLALRQHSRLASHWSEKHTLFYSAVRYGTFSTER